MKKLIIGYSPFEATDNSYTESAKRVLSNFGQVASIPALKEMFKNFLFFKYDLLVFNWTDNNFIDHKNGSIKILGVIKEFIKAFGYKLLAKKIIFVRHNIYPHNTSLKSKGLVVKITNLYEKCFDICWVHSAHLAQDSRLYIPHPLYKISIAKDLLFEEIKLPEKYFIIFGRILSYKKIDKLLEVLPDEIKLVICGSCSDNVYLEKLKSYKKNNVTIIPRYISDSLAKEMTIRSLGMVICHADDDMIVSGSIIFAISIGIPIIAIETPFITWFRSVVNMRMITTAANFSELAEKMLTFQSNIDSADIFNSQEHFSDQSVKNQISISLNKIGLI